MSARVLVLLVLYANLVACASVPMPTCPEITIHFCPV